jgi:tetratricopeptide (TPR) repeat protein
VNSPSPSRLGLVAAVALAAAAAPSTCLAQEGSVPPSAYETMPLDAPAVYGYVTDAHHKPIEGARVEILLDSSFSVNYALTDQRGFYAIIIPEVSDFYEVRVSADGFYPQSEETPVRSRERMDFALVPDQRPREEREMRSPRRLKADKTMREGLKLAEEGKQDEAIARLRQATELDPSYVAAHNNLGVSLRRGGDVVGAEEQFRRALELNHLDYYANFNLGALLYAAGRFHEAPPALEYAVLADPTSAPAEAMLGRSYLAIGLAKRALQHLQEAQRMAGKGMDLSLEISKAYVETGDLESALQVREKWLSNHSDDPRAQRVEATVGAIQERLGKQKQPDKN